MDFQGKVVVVTGAGSGMGRTLSLGLVERGAQVAGIDLHGDTLAETAGLAEAAFAAFPLDITDAQAVQALPNKIASKIGPVDAIINCAGIIQPFVRLKDLDDAAIRRVMDVNFYGTLAMTRAFLPGLLERPEGLVANISSMGGLLPVPGQTVYGASKAAVKLMTEGLTAELQDTSVKVSVIYPGAVATNIAENSGVHIDTDGGGTALAAAEAARVILHGLEKDQPRILVGKDARMMDRLYRLNPVRAMRLIAKKMASLLGPDSG